MKKKYMKIWYLLISLMLLAGCAKTEILQNKADGRTAAEAETENGPAPDENTADTKAQEEIKEEKGTAALDARTEEEQQAEESDPLEYEAYTGEIPHIFTHCLIAYPEIKNSEGNMYYDTDCINVTEFKRVLEQLYENGYSLIDIRDAYEEDDNHIMRLAESVQVPKGRKPLIFSIDDVVYDERKRGNGMVDFLDVDEEGNIVAGTREKDGSTTYSSDNECFPILEEFIKEHPDFSSRGARLTLCMTGFTGQFGYRTDRHNENKADRESQKAKAVRVAERLKELGYSFASHSYGHYDITQLSAGRLEEELKAFQEEVVPVIGETDIFVYPYGKLVYPGDERYALLQKYGFKVFCSVSHFFFARDYEEGHSIYMTRVSLDGYSLRNYKTVLEPLMDVDKVIDRENRLP